MANPVDGATKAVNKIKDILKIIKKMAKFLMSTIGRIIAVLILVIFIILLFSIIIEIVAGGIKDDLGIDWNYATYDKDLNYIINGEE